VLDQEDDDQPEVGVHGHLGGVRPGMAAPPGAHRVRAGFPAGGPAGRRRRTAPRPRACTSTPSPDSCT
jgi:hypothetical protein